MTIETKFGDPSIPGATEINKISEPIPMRIDILNCFNNTIDHINDLGKIINDLDEEIPPTCVDVSFQIAIERLKDVAKRALELKDTKLLSVCEALGIIKLVTGGENLQ